MRRARPGRQGSQTGTWTRRRRALDLERAAEKQTRRRTTGRQSTLLRYEAMPHAFLRLPVSEAEAALADASTFLREKLRA